MLVNVYKLPVYMKINSRDLMYSMVTTVNNIVYLKVAMRVEFKCSHYNNNNNNKIVIT